MPGPTFGLNSEADAIEVTPGLVRRGLVWGARMHFVEFRVPKGSGVPRHRHHHEQVGYVVSGRFAFTVGDETRELGPGDAYFIPGGVEHGSQALEDAVVIDVFSPIREDYLPVGGDAAAEGTRGG